MQKKKKPEKLRGYSPSGTRLNAFKTYAEEQNLLFTLSVLQGIEDHPPMSMQRIADELGVIRDTIIRFFRVTTPDDLTVQWILRIAEMLDLDPIQSLNQYFFRGEHIERATQFYIAFNTHFMDATPEERLQAFSITSKFLSLPTQGRDVFVAMLDVYVQAHTQHEATPLLESGLSDTPSEE
jgi:hypothetical protein